MTARAVRRGTGQRMLTILVTSGMLSGGSMRTPASRGTTEPEPVPPEVAANLDAARAAARAARETASKRKAARQTNHLNVTAAAETPPAKRHQSESMVPSGMTALRTCSANSECYWFEMRHLVGAS